MSVALLSAMSSPRFGARQNGKVERVGNFPSILYSLIERCITHAPHSRPLRQSMRFAFVRDEPIGALVVVLLQRHGPSTIRGLVIASLVWKAIQRVARGRSFAHVSQKCREVVAPLLAHRDSNCAVVGVGRTGRIETAHLCADPCAIGGGREGSFPVTMNGATQRGFFVALAAAPIRSAGMQQRAMHESFSAADASTERTMPVVFIHPPRSKSCPVAEFQSRLEWFHAGNTITIAV